MKIDFYDESTVWMYSVWDSAYAVLVKSCKNTKNIVFPAVVSQSEYRLIRGAADEDQNIPNSLHDMVCRVLSVCGASPVSVEIFLRSKKIYSRLVLKCKRIKHSIETTLENGLYFHVRLRCALFVERVIYEEAGLSVNQALSIAYSNMRSELDVALAQENYELAAHIRDMLAKIQ